MDGSDKNRIYPNLKYKLQQILKMNNGSRMQEQFMEYASSFNRNRNSIENQRVQFFTDSQMSFGNEQEQNNRYGKEDKNRGSSGNYDHIIQTLNENNDNHTV